MAGGAVRIPEYHALLELVIRVVLLTIFGFSEHMVPFERRIDKEELWLYRNPPTSSYVPAKALWVVVGAICPIAMLVVCLLHRGKRRLDVIEGFWAYSLALGLNGVLTNTVKLIVGRPRPDYFYRCFAKETDYNEAMSCTGDMDIVIEGRKSFPSGHSSFSFTSLGFVTFYLCGKLATFATRGQRQTWRLLVSMAPCYIAACIAMSRTCDYHHHWQDVIAGSLLGLTMAYVCYRRYYPPLTSDGCEEPLQAKCEQDLPVYRNF